MLDDKTLRQRYTETRDERKRLADQLRIVTDLEDYYLRLLEARGLSRTDSARSTPRANRPKRSGEGISPTSVRGAVLGVLREEGRPLHTKVIADRLRQRGVRLGGKDRTSVVDLALLSLSQRTTIPVRKVAPRTWVLEEGR